MGWREYWEGDSPVYVNERHKRAHYSGVARDICRLIGDAQAHVLDYGCGEALSADRVAGECARLYLLDGSDRVRQGLVGRFGALAAVSVLSPEDIERIPDASLDLAIINSLLQYLDAAERDRVLAVIARKLKATGRLVIADVVPPDVGALTDASALIGFAARSGFLVAAGVGLVRTLFSDYRRVRAELGLARYDASEMLGVLARAGYAATPAARNIGHNQRRLAFMAQPARAATHSMRQAA